MSDGISIKKENFYNFTESYKIVIPLIQRDYAQGRESEKWKAKNFLKAINDSSNTTLNLDFIYGKVERSNDGISKFIPLDGQQRLTTLFLIHWYLSLENNYISSLRNFSYEVRDSSTDFIKELTEEKNWKELKKNDIKKQIENSNWFFLSWKKDPTVVSILNMLDLIEKEFKDTNLENLDITFETFCSEKFGSVDEIYIKMNARGKQLTLFENFKATFQNYIENLSENDLKELKVIDNGKKERIKAKLDNDYLDIFWNHVKKGEVEKIDIKEILKRIDSEFYDFFYNVTLNFYLEEYEKFPTESTTIFDFDKLVFGNKDKVKEILQILDKLLVLGEIPKLFCDSKNLTDQNRLKIYALSLGYIHISEKKEFKRWERVSFNLINNQLIQNKDHVIKAIQSLKSLVQQSNNNIYEFIKLKLKQGSESIPSYFEPLQRKEEYLSKSIPSYFEEVQRKEEYLKASLILSNDLQWEKELIKAEEHWYLKGQIGFLLGFSNNSLEKFIEYRDKFIRLFDEPKIDKNKSYKYLIYRALLTKKERDFDLPKIRRNRNRNNFIPSGYQLPEFNLDLRTKKENWRLLFIKNDFKCLLDSLSENIEESLKKIISNFLNETKPNEHFFYPLIEDESITEECHKIKGNLFFKSACVSTNYRLYALWKKLKNFNEQFEINWCRSIGGEHSISFQGRKLVEYLPSEEIYKINESKFTYNDVWQNIEKFYNEELKHLIEN